jgi:hypothetical protein
MSTNPEEREPSEEELRAAFEEQLRQITSFDVIAQTAISLVNLAGRRLGLTEDTKDERDLLQVRDCVDAVRALLPILERSADGPSLAPLRDALASIQMEYARLSQASPAPAPESAGAKPAAAGGQEPAAPAGGSAVQSGRLWVPGSAERPRK